MIDTPPKSKPFPTKQQIIDYLRDNPGTVGKREIARAFHITGDARVVLKEMLRDLEREGVIRKAREIRRPRGKPLPEMVVLEVLEIDEDGDAKARPVAWDSDDEPPSIIVARPKPGQPAPDVGDRILARLAQISKNRFEGTLVRVLPHLPQRIVGVFEKAAEGGRINPTDRRDKATYVVSRVDAAGARPGEIVVAELVTGGRPLGPQRVKVTERLGMLGDAGSISLIAIHGADIPVEFPEAAMKIARAAKPVTLGERTELRDRPLVTIDGSDARDFDDAVFAEADTDPANPGGFRLIVAIADVAHYVKPGDALDRAAYERGNSVYFPDRVVPMLPEELSNELCSLRPQVDRACMAVFIRIDRKGRKLDHRFVRGLMRSAARLTYEQAQAAIEGRTDEVTTPLVDPVLKPLYAAFTALSQERERRGTLDLDIPERKVQIDRTSGVVVGIEPRERLDSHRLIEEFMILANVCAAETLEAHHSPCMYRIHDQPSDEKLSSLREFLGTLDLPLAKGQVIKPMHFMQLLRKVIDTPYQQLVNQVVLRSQAQAAYSPDNIGHFGLALARYAHFTSPIRRYADLIVHRGLIGALKLGSDGLTPQQSSKMEAIGVHISGTERRAAEAERSAVERYTASFLASRRGAVFAARVSGVTRFGLFVTLIETGADGLLPMRSLPQDYYHVDEALHRLVGERTGRIFTLGDRLNVLLGEVDIATGSLTLQIVQDEGEEHAQASDRGAARKPLKRPQRNFGPRGRKRR